MRQSRIRRPSRRIQRRSRTYTLRTDAKKNRSNRRLIRLSAFFIVSCALIYGGIKGFDVLKDYAEKSEILKIKSISVSGTKNISRGEILALLPFDIGDNILVQDIQGAEKKILKIKPEIKKITISRYPKKILISVKERIPVAFVEEQGKRLGVDYDNVPFPLRGEYAKAKLPEIVALNDSDREEILEFVRIFSDQAKDFFDRSVTFYYESVEDVALKLDDGKKIIWGKNERDKFPAKLTRLREVWADAAARFPSIEYVNMNFLDSGRVLVKPKITQK